MPSWPSMVAFMAEPHTLWMVAQPAVSGRPACSAAWRAGAWPWPACSTQPISTSSIRLASMPARATAALIASAPRLAAVRLEKPPWNEPMAVRAAETMTMGSFMGGSPALWLSDLERQGVDGGLVAGMQLFVAFAGDAQVLDDAVLEAEEPAVQGHRLAPVPGVLDHRRMAEIGDRFD